MNVGVCRECETRSKQLVTASRTGGGTYRRPPRQYRSSICLPCAKRLLETAPTYAMATVNHWSVSSLRYAVEHAEHAERTDQSATSLDADVKQGDQ